VWQDVSPLLYYKFTAESALNVFLKWINISQNYGEKLIASSAMCAGALC